MGYLWGRWSSSSWNSSYIDVAMAWLRLNVTHGFESMMLRKWLHSLGVPLQILVENDSNVALGALLSITGAALARYRMPIR